MDGDAAPQRLLQRVGVAPSTLSLTFVVSIDHPPPVGPALPASSSFFTLNPDLLLPQALAQMNVSSQLQLFVAALALDQGVSPAAITLRVDPSTIVTVNITVRGGGLGAASPPSISGNGLSPISNTGAIAGGCAAAGLFLCCIVFCVKRVRRVRRVSFSSPTSAAPPARMMPKAVSMRSPVNSAAAASLPPSLTTNAAGEVTFHTNILYRYGSDEQLIAPSRRGSFTGLLGGGIGGTSASRSYYGGRAARGGGASMPLRSTSAWDELPSHRLAFKALPYNHPLAVAQMRLQQAQLPGAAMADDAFYSPLLLV